jgi:hypothetical protein
MGKNFRSVTILCSWMLLLATASHAQVTAGSYPGKAWDFAETPEESGWSSKKLQAAKDYSATINTAAVIIVDDGVIVDQWVET